MKGSQERHPDTPIQYQGRDRDPSLITPGWGWGGNAGGCENAGRRPTLRRSTRCEPDRRLQAPYAGTGSEPSSRGSTPSAGASLPRPPNWSPASQGLDSAPCPATYGLDSRLIPNSAGSPPTRWRILEKKKTNTFQQPIMSSIQSTQRSLIFPRHFRPATPQL